MQKNGKSHQPQHKNSNNKRTKIKIKKKEKNNNKYIFTQKIIIYLLICVFAVAVHCVQNVRKCSICNSNIDNNNFNCLFTFQKRKHKVKKNETNNKRKNKQTE